MMENFSFYNFDGTCNNPINPLWGAAGEASIRLLPSSYIDGVDKPQSDIPSARLIAQLANSQKPGTQTNLPFINNDWTNGFSQLMAHDSMRHVKYQTAGGGTGYSCCSGTDPGKINYNSKNLNCQPIPVAGNDTTYGPKNVTCLNYIRTMLTHQQCQVQQEAQPVNMHTPFLDLEQVYNKPMWDHLNSNGGKFNLNNATLMKQLILTGLIIIDLNKKPLNTKKLFQVMVGRMSGPFSIWQSICFVSFITVYLMSSHPKIRPLFLALLCSRLGKL